METDISTFKGYLYEMLARADKTSTSSVDGETPSTEALQARMWMEFLPVAIKMYTIAGVLQRIAVEISKPEEDDEDDDDDEE